MPQERQRHLDRNALFTLVRPPSLCQVKPRPHARNQAQENASRPAGPPHANRIVSRSRCPANPSSPFFVLLLSLLSYPSNYLLGCHNPLHPKVAHLCLGRFPCRKYKATPKTTRTVRSLRPPCPPLDNLWESLVAQDTPSPFFP